MSEQKYFICKLQATDWVAKFMAFFMCSEIISLGLNSFVNKFVSKGVVWDSLLIYGILLYYGFQVFTSVKLRVNKGILYFLCFVIFCIIGLLINPGNIAFIPQSCYSLLILGALLFALSQQSFKIEEIYKSLIPIYWIAIFMGLIHFLTYHQKASFVDTWMSDMTAGYAILPAVLFAIDYSFTQKKAIPWAIIGFVTMFLCGSRGPVAIATIFFFVDFMRYSKNLYQKMILFVLFAIVCVIYQTSVFDLWLVSLDEYLKSKGFTIASLQKVLYYTDMSNGRNDVFSYGVQLIKDSPIVGYGIYYDRGLYSYVHNFVLEVLIDFGLIIGCIICVLVVVCSIKMIRYCMKTNKPSLSIALILILFNLGKLMVSSSYLNEPLFWFFIGLSYKCSTSDSIRFER